MQKKIKKNKENEDYLKYYYKNYYFSLVFPIHLSIHKLNSEINLNSGLVYVLKLRNTCLHVIASDILFKSKYLE